MRSLAAAFSFLTRLPLGRWVSFDAAGVARSSGWFPLVGSAIGAICAGAAFLLRGHLPLPLVAVVLLALDAIVTGALHFDGLADTADGFGGGKDRDDVLRIMRDHAIGSYGATALVVLALFKTAAYSALLAGDRWFAAIALTPAIGRWSILLLTAALPYARQTASIVRGMPKSSLVWGTLILAGAAGASRLWCAAAAAAAAVAVSALFGLYCRRRIGGITGDTLGANVQLCECAALVAFLWGAR
ncbi:MAG TPA: adenosylcobinamide-GDP ribazoletransferase [Bryobacteraceae bacterium]|nr:adenosylcobinamide-GDP ribazoletransferase [Bryobacteraceae bacterium]